MTAQEIFDNCKKNYDQVMNAIEEMSAFARKIAPEFSTRIAKRQYDITIQAILFKIALSDGYFHPIESQFIDAITDTGDALIRFNQIMREEHEEWVDISWDDVARFTGEQGDEIRKAISDRVDLLAEEAIEAFTECFKLILVKEGEEIGSGHLDSILDGTCEIIKGIMSIDGDVLEEETEAAIKYTNELFLKYWQINEDSDEPQVTRNGTAFVGGKQ